MKMELALREVWEAESELGSELLRAGERHKADHDVFHLTRTLARWSDAHVRSVAAQATRYGVELAADGAESGGPLSRMREKSAELLGRRPEAGVLLLRDLRELYLVSARASFGWTLLGQGAQAVSDTELLAVVTDCHPQTIRTMKWTVQRMKEAGPQVLAS